MTKAGHLGKHSINPTLLWWGFAFFRGVVGWWLHAAAALRSLRRSWPELGVRGFVGVGLLVVCFGGFDQAVNQPAGGRTLGCVDKQPVLAADYDRPDCALGSVIVDGQAAGFDVAQQATPVAD